MSCDQKKVEEIITAGRPGNTEDVRSFLQAVAFNAKFAFDHREEKSYEEASKPLRELLVKDAMFEWNKDREECYRMLQRMITNNTTLRLFDIQKMHLVSDASLEEISVSLYQEDQDGSWVPVDHCHRVFSAAE